MVPRERLSHDPTLMDETDNCDSTVQKKGPCIADPSQPSTLNPNVWYLHGKAYDFTDFVKRHPGGEKAILIGQGRDCTELFESYHTFLPSDKLLAKYALDKEGSLGDGSNVLQLAPEMVQFTFKDDGFYRTLKRRAAEHFRKTKSGTKAGIFHKTVGVATITLLFVLAYYGFYQGVFWAAALHGFLRAMIIVRDCHASSHYAWSYNPTMNQWMYRISMAFAGSSPSQWTAKHVVAHHVSTNITPVDDDTMYPMKRVLPELPRRSWHAFQHLYIWVFYCLTIMFWTLSDVVKLAIGHYYEGTTQVSHWSTIDWEETYGVYIFHIAHRWVLPFVSLPFSHAMGIVLLNEVFASLPFVLQFVVNHEVETSVEQVSVDLNAQQPTSELSGTDWGAHQVRTSHNYGVGSPLWLNSSGGLNMQIEHHLFPSVHHSHYQALGELTRRTCKEFNVPYNTSGGLAEALGKHYDLLVKMGRSPEMTT
ncbi:hypothetical protein SARC_05199 [Sphaeroforma arctica JP610]|uniref:Cytochrome b5 heme-binding domain-containing protein n=1 Tax=Sphaeroforma arctica JP610 TaxID=667725 RepID=A0A0L0G131_9EUKA|nr:hypothetical protein SARC_05199 [Sphaeroforma arctica JP610]KNC82526.1 hypothetical protein SARC_05199 [Sphaeroforma arctica JP610]|eukprot:XP_014156428.1 hypothetical protein SARC_05199 [Sphaeroforma arctica JP610]